MDAQTAPTQTNQDPEPQKNNGWVPLVRPRPTPEELASSNEIRALRGLPPLTIEEAMKM